MSIHTNVQKQCVGRPGSGHTYVIRIQTHKPKGTRTLKNFARATMRRDLHVCESACICGHLPINSRRSVLALKHSSQLHSIAEHDAKRERKEEEEENTNTLQNADSVLNVIDSSSSRVSCLECLMSPHAFDLRWHGIRWVVLFASLPWMCV